MQVTWTKCSGKEGGVDRLERPLVSKGLRLARLNEHPPQTLERNTHTFSHDFHSHCDTKRSFSKALSHILSSRSTVISRFSFLLFSVAINRFLSLTYFSDLIVPDIELSWRIYSKPNLWPSFLFSLIITLTPGTIVKTLDLF